ncbi:SHOCT domain-containing protein [Mycobacterium sp. 050272]|uniref:SHOCT domain-containing protein n=1 Tax=Mycobacterium sp. 050272 TaxID=3142488 RepID=UPI00319A9051
MNASVTPEATKAVDEIAARHGLSRDAVLTMLFALRAGSGTMAQFNIPELGGSGQWMRGGMTMVGDMFDNALKARVDALCNELVQLLATTTVFPASTTQSQIGFSANNWWPADLGVPSAVGAQNDVRYAFFPSSRRLVIEIGGVTRVFDTGEHHIGGVQQQQGGGISSVGFSSQLGTFGVLSLRELGVQPAETPTPQTPAPETPAAAPETPAPSAAAGGPTDAAAIIAAIESLAGLHERGILSDQEFATKKAELLSRL